ncbi:MAG: guanylate kinase [Lachnospiraceae bacterium]|jgi:guanylate kinase|nr:guanylate kinase [Lachnospiraceae bacterium]
MKDRGILIIVSGFSGAGKGTVMKKLMSEYDNYALSISATTRSPRPGEQDGREYFFKTVEEFETMIENNQLIEYAKYVGNYYGTPKEYVEKMLDEGKDVILEIEMQGTMKVKEMMPETVLVFITPPTAEELKKRLEGRGTEDSETIKARLKRASEEVVYMDKYDYLLINDKLDECVENLHKIVQMEHSKVSRNINKINFFREDLKIFSEGE